MLNPPLLFEAPLVNPGPYQVAWYSPQFIAQDQIQKTAFGRFLAKTVTLNCSPALVEDWLLYGLGRHVTMYDTGLSVVWEGFVNMVTGQIGQRSTRVGPLVGGVLNKLKVSYSYIDTTTGDTPTLGGRDSTAFASNALSQARYGVLEGVLSVSGSTPTLAAQIRDTALAEMAWPHVAESDSWGQGDTRVHLECLGYIHWLDAYIYNSTSTGDTNASTKLQNVLAADPNSIFSTTYTRIDTNTTQVPQWEDEDRTAMTVTKGIVSEGDAALSRWMFYLKPGRLAYYHAKPTTEYYHRSLRDPDQAVRLATGQARVEPWGVVPGEWAMYTDFMITEAATSMAQDMRYSFLERVDLSAPWDLSVQGNIDYRLDRLLARMGLGGTVV